MNRHKKSGPIKGIKRVFMRKYGLKTLFEYYLTGS
jgi:hypothetical protein